MLEPFNWIGKNVSMNWGMGFISSWKITLMCKNKAQNAPFVKWFFYSLTQEISTCWSKFRLLPAKAPWNRAQSSSHLGSNGSAFVSSYSSFLQKLCTLSLKQEAARTGRSCCWPPGGIEASVTSLEQWQHNLPSFLHHLTAVFINTTFFTFIAIANLSSTWNFTHSHPFLLRRKHDPYVTNRNFCRLCTLSIISKAFLHMFTFFHLSFHFKILSFLLCPCLHLQKCTEVSANILETVLEIYPAKALSSILDVPLSFSFLSRPSCYTTGRCSLRRPRGSIYF